MAFNIRRFLATISIFLVAVVLFGADIYAQPLLPPAASSFADEIDLIFWVILGITTFFFILVFVLLIYFMIRYRAKGPNEEGINFHGHLGLEIAWTIIPAVLFVAIAIYSADILTEMDNPPAGALEIEVEGVQFGWNFAYEANTSTGVVTNQNELHIPVNEPVVLNIISKDVLHSFWVPAFRLKQDALPDQVRILWFEATQTGTFPVICAELCGAGHSQMLATVVVQSREDYDNWVQQKADEFEAQDPAAQRGSILANERGCLACHSVDGARLVGPTWLDLFEKEESLDDGTTAIADEAYLIESIRDPNAKVVESYFANIMQPYGPDVITDDEVSDIIAYIRSLKSGEDSTASSDTAPDNTDATDSSTDTNSDSTDTEDTADNTDTTDAPDAGDNSDSSDGANSDLTALGLQLAQTSCLFCHSIDGSQVVGPSWLGLYGATQVLSDGSSVTVDESYLERAIRDPNAEVPEGYNPSMPPFSDAQLTDDDIDAIIEYIKSLTN